LSLTPFCATLLSVEVLAPNIKGFVLHCAHPDFYRLPGQWIHVGREIEGQFEMTSFSVATSTTEMGTLELAIKASARHPLTRWLHESARVGDCLQISGGQGDFLYRPEMGQRVVLIGAGTGITPLMSIFRNIDEQGVQADATLIYSIARPEEFLFRADIERISTHPRLHSLITLTQAHPEWHGLNGRINAALLQQAGIDGHTLYYLCGPQAMVDELSDLLLRLGVPAQHVVYEKWW
jgi:ferredoxin-NADP reductase